MELKIVIDKNRAEEVLVFAHESVYDSGDTA